MILQLDNLLLLLIISPFFFLFPIAIAIVIIVFAPFPHKRHFVHPFEGNVETFDFKGKPTSISLNKINRFF